MVQDIRPLSAIDLHPLEGVLGIFDSKFSAEEASIEVMDSRITGVSGYKLVLPDIDNKRAGPISDHFKRKADGAGKPIFTQVDSVSNAGGKTQDVVAVINLELQEELIAYMKERGAKVSTNLIKLKSENKEQVTAWSKGLAEEMHKHLEGVYNLFDGNKSLKGQIRTMQRDHLDVLRVDGPNEPEVSVAYTALTSKLNGFLKEAKIEATRRESQPALNILIGMTERLENFAHDAPVQDEAAVQNESLEKLINGLRKAGVKAGKEQFGKFADQLAAIDLDPAQLAAKIDEIESSGVLPSHVRVLLKTIQASLSPQLSGMAY
ncbi:MAG: hypothetical protein P8P30_07180 [Rickettsiales bacterium]|nr:hypothetical protein [Rickettsiales bacterium]